MIESIDRALEELPKGLSESYDRIYQKIQSGLAPEIEMANRTLKWIMSAPDPLTSGELLSAVRIHIENDDIKLKDPIEQDTLLSICGNFLIVDSNDQWRFFHLSVLEYLQNFPEFNRQKRLHCAQVCFLSLMRTFGRTEYNSLPNENDSTLSSADFVNPFNATNDFSKHIQTNWPFYASELTKNDGPFLSLEKFLGSTNKSSPFFIWWANHLFEKGFSVSFRSLKTHRLCKSDLAPFATTNFCYNAPLVV